ncbi:cytochrome b/b6 domain-containing protein [Streptomyces sp. AV19]|uniref:cytochrome b/b6 domain-containing protein n=1 Tax=Streptomyces sp. AV19 TaxID=2793068 RepID=UPI0018FE7DA5|nr:cytochrome b/b6 domain-containing protein [Streptomyces sp. AV19]MBH1935965.1 cytochrome b/b6 domain-containing protein [Streptomyces sp. AV19]MDG4534243.1 cytochrome b/b6 domain-containing protein [Streptomyces sp. AV19]
MPDRRRPAVHRPPLPRPVTGLLARSSDQRDNPFAPPPEGRPDEPWRPRAPQGDQGDDGGGNGGQQQPAPPAWGSQWSNRQPGRHDGGFGGPPGGGQDPSNGPGASGPRWDPSDPAQRRARYAVLAGLWGFFFALFSLPEVALLLGALSVYWGVSALRAKGAARRTGEGGAPAPQPGGFRPQTTAAVSGLVMGGLALLIVVSTYGFQLVYRDYYTCVDDALTQSSRQACETHLPKQLRPLLGADD